MENGVIRVLVVDDDPLDTLATRRALQASTVDYHVECVSSFDEAVAAVADRYDVALIDYCLGLRNGLDLIRLLRGMQPSLPTILLTGADDSRLDLEALRAGAADYLSKNDFTTSTLDRAIRYAIERARVQDELTRLAHYDQLTGLPNRAFFGERLKDGLKRARRLNGPLALLFLDLNGFKVVNDTMGHDAGDQLLQIVAKRLAASVREVDAVGRVGGDEFVVILEGMKKDEDVSVVAQRVMDSFEEPCKIDGRPYMISASMGIALYPSDTTDQDELIRFADAAMYKAKQAGGGFKCYQEDMARSAEDRAKTVAALQAALENEEFVLHYQPQIDLATNKVIGVEALVRWQRGDRLVPPFQFIPALEESGLIVPVGEWVLRKACTDIARWRRNGLPDCRVAVNVSPRQFRSGRLPSTIETVLAETGLPGSALEIELTEGLVMADTEESIVALHALKACGVRISIDDFGTGYSSLAYLKRFPVDVLKVDRSFIKDIPDTDDGVIAQAVISLAYSLGLETIAEGVETEEQLAFLANTTCEGYQGYFFSRPVPEAECYALLREHGAEAREAEWFARAVVEGTKSLPNVC